MYNVNSGYPCPVCSGAGSEEILSLVSPELITKLLPNHVRIRICNSCKHIFNELSFSEYQNLLEFYAGNFDSNSTNSETNQDKPGSLSTLSLMRYQETAEYLEKSAQKNCYILDIGCAEGGFLKYLESKGFQNLNGIDINPSYLEIAKSRVMKGIFRVGTAENVPFSDSFFDVVFLDQVLEHVREPLEVISEVSRVLKNNGRIIFGVPDVSRYQAAQKFPYYWFLLKEHIQHFNINSLNLLLARKSYSLLNYKEVFTPMFNAESPLPNLIAEYQKTSSEITINRKLIELNKFNLDSYLTRQEEMFEKIKSKLEYATTSNRKLICWGISRELQYLLGAKLIEYSNITEIIDSDFYKVEKFNENNKATLKAKSPYAFGIETQNAVLLITAVAHSIAIKNNAKEMGFRGEIINIDFQE